MKIEDPRFDAVRLLDSTIVWLLAFLSPSETCAATGNSPLGWANSITIGSGDHDGGIVPQAIATEKPASYYFEVCTLLGAHPNSIIGMQFEIRTLKWLFDILNPENPGHWAELLCKRSFYLANCLSCIAPSSSRRESYIRQVACWSCSRPTSVWMNINFLVN
jgi:hypothetical protein